jgi:hypothetical protein
MAVGVAQSSATGDVSSRHMAGIFRAAAKPSLVWGTADLQIIGGKIPDKTLPDPAIMTTDAKVFMDAPFCDDISNNRTYDGHDDSNHDLRKPISHLWAPLIDSWNPT